MLFRDGFGKILEEENFVWREIFVWHLDGRPFGYWGRDTTIDYLLEFKKGERSVVALIIRRI